MTSLRGNICIWSAAGYRPNSPSSCQSQDTEHEIYHDDAIVEYSQSGERIPRATQRASPSQPAPGEAVGLCRPAGCRRGDLWVTEYVITYDGRRIMEFQAERVDARDAVLRSAV